MYSVTFIADGRLNSIATPSKAAAVRILLSLRHASIVSRLWHTASKGEPRLIC